MSESVTFSLAIPHCPWVPERVESVQRLERLLGIRHFDQDAGRDYVIPGRRPHQYTDHVAWFTDREPNHSWSGKLWKWGYSTGATHLVQLQDDVIVDANFWPNLRAMCEAVPDQIIGLESVHPLSRQVYDNGGNWYTTADGLIGVGYVLPRAVLAELLEWRSARLRPGAIEAISEDTLIDVFCMSTGRKVWHPVPTIIDHDVAMASTYGNDKHAHRRPLVTTVGGDVVHGYGVGDVPHLGRFYQTTPRLCRRWVKGFSVQELERVQS